MFYILILIAIKQWGIIWAMNYSYWIYDTINNHTDQLKITGPSRVEFRLNFFNFNYEYKSQFRCYWFSRRQCDPVIIAEMCQVQQEKGSWRNEFNTFMNQHMTDSAYSCDGSVKRFEYWHDVEKTYKMFKCTGPDIYLTYDENAGSCVTVGQQFLTMTYPKLLVAAGMVMNRLSDKRSCKTYLYKTFSINNIAKDKLIYKVLLQKARILFEYNTIQLSVQYKVTCQQFYYLPYCWYYCKPSNRSNCTNGEQKCNSNWGYELVRYIKPGFDDIIKYECLFKDRCREENCTITHTVCLPYANNSFVCCNTKPTYNCGGESYEYNVSDSLAVVSESFQCNFDVPQVIRGRYFTNFCAHPTEGEKHKLISCNGGVIIPLSTILEGFELKVKCYVAFLEGYIVREYNQVLSFAKRATYVTLFNISIGFGKSIYVGQSFRCITDGWPAKYFYYTVTLLTYNFIMDTPVVNVRGDKNIDILVPNTAVLGFCIVNCKVMNDFQNGRTRKNLNHVFDFGLKSYVYFGWEHEYKNIYLYDEIIDCTFESFIVGIIRMRQFRGMHRIKETRTTFIRLNFPVGGDYGFFCILEFEKTSYLYTKRKEFELFEPPRHLCFQLFPFIRGSLIQCSSNIYPSDLAKTEIYISDVSHEEIFATSVGLPYIRIPYDLPVHRAFIKCVVDFKYKSFTTSLSINRTITIRPIFKDQISHDVISRDCLQFGAILEQDDMYYVGKGIFEFHKPLFTLIPEKINVNIQYPELFSLVIPLFALLLFFMMINSVLMKHRTILLEAQIRKYSRVAFYRRLNDNLMINAIILSDRDSPEAQKMLLEIHTLFKNEPSIFGFNFLRNSKIQHLGIIRDIKKSYNLSELLKVDPALESLKSSKS